MPPYTTFEINSEDHDYGRFAWITDPDGNRIELWEPKDDCPQRRRPPLNFWQVQPGFTESSQKET